MQHVFIIDPREEVSIYKEWRAKARKDLHNIFHDIQENGANTHWLLDKILQALRAHWDSPGLRRSR